MRSPGHPRRIRYETEFNRFESGLFDFSRRIAKRLFDRHCRKRGWGSVRLRLYAFELQLRRTVFRLPFQLLYGNVWLSHYAGRIFPRGAACAARWTTVALWES